MYRQVYVTFQSTQCFLSKFTTSSDSLNVRRGIFAYEFLGIDSGVNERKSIPQTSISKE